ncbi:MAG: hypothetical protein ABJA18_11980 [bacterium]
MSAHKVWRKAFLKSLADCGIVRAAAEEAGISPKAAYNLRHSDPEFAADWQASLDLAADSLEGEIRRRAFAGSDLLAIFLMKGLRPEKFREKVYVSTAQLDTMIERELSKLKDEQPEEPTEAVN